MIAVHSYSLLQGTIRRDASAYKGPWHSVHVCLFLIRNKCRLPNKHSIIRPPRALCHTHDSRTPTNYGNVHTIVGLRDAFVRQELQSPVLMIRSRCSTSMKICIFRELPHNSTRISIHIRWNATLCALHRTAHLHRIVVHIRAHG